MARSTSWFSKADGSTDTQAGSHPLRFDGRLRGQRGSKRRTKRGTIEDHRVALPPGIVGDPHAVPRCTRQEFEGAPFSACPPDTTVGIDWPGLSILEKTKDPGDPRSQVPVYNLVPPPGVPAEFGFTVFGTNVLLEATVRSGSDYGITTTAATSGADRSFNSFTLWGIPDESVHDGERCGHGASSEEEACGYARANTHRARCSPCPRPARASRRHRSRSKARTAVLAPRAKARPTTRPEPQSGSEAAAIFRCRRRSPRRRTPATRIRRPVSRWT